MAMAKTPSLKASTRPLLMSDPCRPVACLAMAIYALGDVEPRIDPTAFVHPDATVIGDVTIGPESSVWPQAVLRGDHGSITIGARSSIQDGSVIHTGPQFPTRVGDGCVIGHLVHLEGCTIEDDALVGSGATVLHYVVVGQGALVGAGALLTNHTKVPPGALAIGVPAVIKPGASYPDLIRTSADEYVRNVHRFRAELRRID